MNVSLEKKRPGQDCNPAEPLSSSPTKENSDMKTNTTADKAKQPTQTVYVPLAADASGVIFLAISNDRSSIERTVERLVNMLDDMEADADDEPWLGAAERHPENGYGRELKREKAKHSQLSWTAGGASDDREDDDEREDVSEDEGANTGDDEYSHGWQDEGSQAYLACGSTWCGGECEPDLGFVGIATGYRAGEGLDDREQNNGSDDEREDQCEDEGAQCDDDGVVDSGIADADGLAWVQMAQTEGIGAGKGKGLRNPSLPPEHYPDEFCFIADGKCCEPSIMDGSYVICDKRKPYKRGDFVVIFRKPGTVRPSDHVMKVKRFVQEFPSGLVVEMLNPHKALYYDKSEVLAVWHALPAAADFVPGPKVTDGALLAERAKRLSNGVVVREFVDRRFATALPDQVEPDGPRLAGRTA